MTTLDHAQHFLGIGCQLVFVGSGVLAAAATVTTAWPKRHRILAVLRGEHLSPAPLATARAPQLRGDEAAAKPAIQVRA